MLSSFRNRRKDNKKINLITAALRRVHSPPSPTSFATPEALPQSRPQKTRRSGNPLSLLKSSPPVRHSSPQVHLDFRNDSTDWFPPFLLGNESEVRETEAETSVSDHGPENDYPGEDDVVLIGEPPEEEDMYSPEIPLTSSETSSLHNPHSPIADTPSASSEQLDPRLPRKHAPAPIKIPNNLSKVQIARSASAGASGKVPSFARGGNTSALSPSSRPESCISSDDISAISGTTLARALIANSFILSNDNPRSRYRSGGNMTRQDSATLPRGENALVNSPYWKDKRISGGEIVVTPDSGRTSPIPPVPPLPRPADMGLGADFAPLSSAQSSLNRLSSGGHSVRRNSEERRPPSLRPERQSSRRVSRISEAPSSIPSAPNTPERLDRAKAPEQLLSPQSSTTTELSLSAQTESTWRSRNSSKGSYTEGPTSAGSGDDIDNVLNNYQFISPLKSSFPSSIPTHFHSPALSSASVSAESPYSLGSSRPSVTSATSTSGASATSMGTPQSEASGRGKRLPELAIKRTIAEGGVAKSPRNSGKGQGLLPIGSRPQSVNIPQSPLSRKSDEISNHRQSLSSSRNSPYDVTSPDLLDFMFLPSQRPGNLAPRPNPIKIIRESQIPDDSDSTIGTPATADVYRQTFPETPSAFSPLWSSTTPHLPKVPGIPSEIHPGMPRSASFQKGIRGRKQSVPKRSVSLNQSAMKRLPLSSAKPEMSPIPSTPTPLSSSSEFGFNQYSPAGSSGTRPSPGLSNPSSAGMTGTTAVSTPVLSDDNSATNGGDSSVLNTPNTPSVRRRDSIEVEAVSTRLSVASGGSTVGIASNTSANTSTTDLAAPADNTPERSSPKVKPLPQKPKLSQTDVPNRRSRSLSPIVARNPPPQITQRQQSDPYETIPKPSSSDQDLRSPQPTIPPSQSQPPLPPLHLLPILPPPGVSTPAGPSMHISPATPNPPASATGSPQQVPRGAILSFLRQSYGEDSAEALPPPPYQHAIQTEAHTEPEQPVAASSSLPSYGHVRSGSALQIPRPQEPSVGGPSSAPSSYRITDQRPLVSDASSRRPSVSDANSRRPSVSDPNARRLGRSRPPLPAGPRKISATRGSVMGMPRRNESITSLNGVSGEEFSSKSSAHSGHQRTPRFQTTPVRWRGIPMDVAKWTFSSQQLQEIVSRAIKQSAEASSIRLLNLDTLDRELPDEMHKLELTSTDMRAKLKMAVTRRRSLLSGLVDHTAGTEVMDAATLASVVEELSEVSSTVDELAEEIHNVNDQISQLKRLCDIHSASALSMALRKLNTSFLRQATEAQMLRDRVATLEAERDVAWTHAAHVAQEFDDLTDKVEQSGLSPIAAPDLTSRRSSRIMAVRKSSVRLSKSGLRSASANRKSMQRNSSSGLISSRSVQNIPRVPPLANRPPFIQTTNLQMRGRHSAGIYTDATPTTETRALAQAQKELCEMLGIDVQDVRPQQRPRSYSVSGSTRHSLVPSRTRRNSDANIGLTCNLDNYLDPMNALLG